MSMPSVWAVFCADSPLYVGMSLTYVIVLCSLHTHMAADIRSLIDKELASRDTDFETFVAKGRAAGKSVMEITDDLCLVTGIPVTWRTVYRWLEKKAEAS